MLLHVAALFLAQAIPAKASTVQQFVPQGWTLEQQKSADFNADGRKDVLILLRRAEATKGSPERIVAVALRASGARARYELFESNQQLIPHTGDEGQEDPMADGELNVRPRGFEVKFSLMSSAGSYQMMTVRYRFRFDRDCFRLIGYDRMETHRGTLDTRDTSVNFLTGAVIQRTGNAESNGSKSRRYKLRSKPRLCLGNLESAAIFKPTDELGAP
jgi:hypothetical protein